MGDVNSAGSARSAGTEATRRVRLSVTALLGLPLAAAVVVMAARVGEPARFVSWPVVAFTAASAAVTLAGVWVGLPRPASLLAGLLPALVVSYFLPALPFALVALVVVAIGVLAVRSGATVSGLAAGVGVLMTLATVAQGPAVECSRSGASSGDGPWWISAQSTSSGSGSTAAGGRVQGTTQVGEHRYAYTCVDGRLAQFGRARGTP
jgi:hypothetical protein